jgi:hypothetical protein
MIGGALQGKIKCNFNIIFLGNFKKVFEIINRKKP